MLNIVVRSKVHVKQKGKQNLNEYNGFTGIPNHQSYMLNIMVWQELLKRNKSKINNDPKCHHYVNNWLVQMESSVSLYF